MSEPLPSLPIVGVCRFSYLGIGDWKAYHSGRKGRSNEQVIDAARKTLFTRSRLSQRFATFEKLTLPSLAAQSDKDFTFIVLTSDELPDIYMTKLKSLEAKYPFMRLCAAAPGRAVDEFNSIYDSMGLSAKDMLQFRLDDDDALGRNYIRKVRHLGNAFHAIDRGRAFAITFPNVLMAANINGNLVFRHRHFPNTAAGQVLYHPSKNVLDWAHHVIDRKVMVISEWYDQWVLQSFLSKSNDGGVKTDSFLQTRTQEISDLDLERVMNRQFPFAKIDAEWWRKMMN